jgi:hypothetical protein
MFDDDTDIEASEDVDVPDDPADDVIDGVQAKYLLSGALTKRPRRVQEWCPRKGSHSRHGRMHGVLLTLPPLPITGEIVKISRRHNATSAPSP